MPAAELPLGSGRKGRSEAGGQAGSRPGVPRRQKAAERRAVPLPAPRGLLRSAPLCPRAPWVSRVLVGTPPKRRSLWLKHG